MNGRDDGAAGRVLPKYFVYRKIKLKKYGRPDSRTGNNLKMKSGKQHFDFCSSIVKDIWHNTRTSVFAISCNNMLMKARSRNIVTTYDETKIKVHFLHCAG